MTVPALIYVAFNAGASTLAGWAIPTASDIAFALAGAAVHPRPARRGPELVGRPGLALLAGIGFTVSLLIGELAFGVGTEQESAVKVGILAGSSLSALLATVVLRMRNRHYRELRTAETRDRNANGVPDLYQETDEQ